MSVTRQSDGNAGLSEAALQSLASCRQELAKGNLSKATASLQRFRSSPVGRTIRQLESDLLELRLTALENKPELASRAAELHRRHARKNNEDAFLYGATELIRRYVGNEAALSWIEQESAPNKVFVGGRRQAVALHLMLLRQVGRLNDARALTEELLKQAPPSDIHPRCLEECIATLRGKNPSGGYDLATRLEAWSVRLPKRVKLRLWNLASTRRILVASTAPVAIGSSDTFREQKLSLTFHRLQATLTAREQRYASAAEHLQQARELSLQIRDESLESLELSLQQFEMLLQANSVRPTDSAWLAHLRGVAAVIGRTIYLEYRLANVWRKAGFNDIALQQYADVAKQYTNDHYGIRAAYQLAVTDEESRSWETAYGRYAGIASLAEIRPSVAMLCLVGAFRCATRMNDEDRKSEMLGAIRSFSARIPEMRQALFAVRQLRQDGLGELSNALLDECWKRYLSLKISGSLNTHKYLELTHHLVRRLYSANRYQEALSLIDSIAGSYWANANFHWEHLAGCLHYGCLSWLALGNPKKAVEYATSVSTPLNTRPSQASHVELSIARVYQQTGRWSWAEELLNRIIARAPSSSAAVKARLQLARRAWETGNIAEARQWAMSLLIDGKANRRDPDLEEAYWSAYSMAASEQEPVAGDDFVYPNLAPKDAMHRQRYSRVVRRSE